MPSFKSFIPVAAFFAYVSAQALVNTPSALAQCEPALLSWSGGTAPYFLEAIPGGDPTGTPFDNFGQLDTTSYTWNVNLPVGTSVTIQVTDSTGAVAYSAAVTVTSGNGDSCLSSSASGSATSAASSTSAVAVTTSASKAATTVSASAKSSSGSASSTGSSSSSAASTSASAKGDSSGASSVKVASGALGALAMVALLAF